MFKTPFYTGKIRHRRFLKKSHQFLYKILMFCFDVDNVEHAFESVSGISVEKFNHFSFYTKNYLPNRSTSLSQHVRQLIFDINSIMPRGKIYLLTQLSCLGYCFNPISLYLIFNENNIDLDYVIVEVTNTPWGERHNYILSNPIKLKNNINVYDFEKKLHVSPFLDMHYKYRLNLKISKSKIIVHMENYKNNEKHFDATLSLDAYMGNNSTSLIKKHRLMTHRITAAIYWQAFKLWLKGINFYSHPKYHNR